MPTASQVGHDMAEYFWVPIDVHLGLLTARSLVLESGAEKAVFNTLECVQADNKLLSTNVQGYRLTLIDRLGDVEIL